MSLLRLLLTALGWPLCWTAVYAADVWFPDASWAWVVLPLLGAALLSLAASGPHPWCTWLWGLVLGNLGICLCIAFQVPAFLVNLRHPGYGPLSAGGGFGVWVLTFHTRRTLLLASPLVLALLTALARDRKA